MTLGGQSFSVDYEPAESHHGDVRRQLQLARPDLDAGQLPADRRAPRVRRAISATTLSRVPDRVRRQPDRSARSPTTCPSGWSTLFLRGADGRRPIYGGTELFQTHPDWRDRLIFPEYFHGDNGAALGASHQTGWTALVADLILGRRP